MQIVSNVREIVSHIEHVLERIINDWQASPMTFKNSNCYGLEEFIFIVIRDCLALYTEGSY